MKKTILLAVTLPTLVYAATPDSPAATLNGYAAGAEKECILAQDRDRDTRLFKDGSVLFRGRTNTWYVNHPTNCPAFAADLAIVGRSTDRLCRGDIIDVVQPSSGTSYGSCALGGFTPYSHAR